MWKNGIFEFTFLSTLSYFGVTDTFKIFAQGKPWTEFRASQVTGLATYSSQKTISDYLLPQAIPITTTVYHVGLYVRYSPQVEYIFVYDFQDEISTTNSKATIERYLPRSEVLVLLNTRERVPLEEVMKILSKRNSPSTEEDARRIVEASIMSGKVDGVIEGSAYVSRSALQRETIRYDIVTKFEVGKNGVLVLTCPNCGASLPVDKKEATGKCGYCGSVYNVPRKILDLV